MNSINQVQQDLLARMEQAKLLSEGAAIRPALNTQPPRESFATAFSNLVRAVDDQQHKAKALAEAVDSGQSDDLVGAMIESQKASVSFSALLQVRNKLTSAFEEIMRTPL